MNVYLVMDYYYDYSEHACGDMILGICASMACAVAARDKFVADKIADVSGANSVAQTSVDDENNPVVTTFYNGELFMDDTFIIEEWPVQEGK